jgi:hypothetical protein
MLRFLGPAALSLALLLPLAHAQEKGKFAVRTVSTAPPTELSEPIRKLLSGDAIEMLDGAGKPIADIWLRKEMPTEAAPEQIKNGITYRELKQSEVVGAVRFDRDWTDYRKQKIKAGVYTLRLAFQPTDGKHTADVSEFQEFVVVLSPKNDKTPALIEEKKLQEISGDSIDSTHPGVFMLVPTKPGNAPEMVARPMEHWMLTAKLPLTAGGKATGAYLGFGINLVGHSPAE